MTCSVKSQITALQIHENGKEGGPEKVSVKVDKSKTNLKRNYLPFESFMLSYGLGKNYEMRTCE